MMRYNETNTKVNTMKHAYEIQLILQPASVNNPDIEVEDVFYNDEKIGIIVNHSFYDVEGNLIEVYSFSSPDKVLAGDRGKKYQVIRRLKALLAIRENRKAGEGENKLGQYSQALIEVYVAGGVKREDASKAIGDSVEVDITDRKQVENGLAFTLAAIASETFVDRAFTKPDDAVFEAKRQIYNLKTAKA